jgi:ParB family chromosome partitioning protein
VGKSRSAVANALRLLKLPEDMKNALSQGKISAGHARALLSVLNSQEQDVLFARIVEAELSVREAEQMAASLNGKGIVTKKKERAKNEGQSPELAYLEEQFREKLGTKVQLKGSLEKGSVEISYFSQEDLDHLFSLLCN